MTRLFFKHLLRSVRRKPLQPLLLVFVLALSVMTATFSASLDRALTEEAEKTQAAKYGAADLCVETDGASKSRFMFVRDAEKVLGADAAVAGCLSLPFSLEGREDALLGVATELPTVGRVFDLSFIAYGRLTPSTVGDAVFVSASLASERGLSVGDRLTLGVLGGTRTYTVTGVCDKDFMDAYAVMVDTSSLVPLLAADSLLLSSVKDGFYPCSTLYIRVISGTAENAALRLSESSLFDGKSARIVSGLVAKENNTAVLSTLIDVAILLSGVLAAACAYGCLYLLGAERAEQNRCFLLAGAKASSLLWLQLFEVCVYAVLGGGVGALLSFLAVQGFGGLIGFRYASLFVRGGDLCLCAAFILAVGAASVIVFWLAEPLRKRKVAPRRRAFAWLLLPAPAAVASLLIFVLPPRMRYGVFALFLVLLLALIFVCTPSVMRWLFTLFGAKMSRRSDERHGVRSPSLFLAVKGLSRVRILHNTARVFALICFVILNVALLMMGATGHIRFADSALTADCLVLGGTESCYSGVASCGGVSACQSVFMQNAQMEDGLPILALGASDTSAFSDGLRPKAAPKGRLAALSIGEANARGLSVGDSFKIKISGKTLEVEIAETVDSVIGAVILDNEYFGLHYNMISAHKASGVTEADMLCEISEATADSFVTVARPQTVLHRRMGALEVYLSAGAALLFFLSIPALLSLFDNLLSSYRMRREELKLYRTLGLSRGRALRVKATEILLSLGFGLAASLLATAAFLPVMNAALRSFSYETFLNLSYYFKL